MFGCRIADRESHPSSEAGWKVQCLYKLLY
jgi:hypothetical protein